MSTDDTTQWLRYEPTLISLADLTSLTRQRWQARRDDPKANHAVDPPAYGGCLDYTDCLIEAYEKARLDYMELRVGARMRAASHAFAAVRTSDAGIVLIDPTIRQNFPDYPDDCFIGTAAQLAQLIQQHGGPNALVPDHSSAAKHDRGHGHMPGMFREYYFQPEAGYSGGLSLLKGEYGEVSNKLEWAQQWGELGPFAPTFSRMYELEGVPADTSRPQCTYQDLLRGEPATARGAASGRQ